MADNVVELPGAIAWDADVKLLITGIATTETDFVPVAAVPSEFITLQDKVSVPTDPAL